MYLANDSVDLMVTDPPYGIEGGILHRHYNRDERFIVGEYVEVPRERYAQFCIEWIAELERVLKPGGQAYIISGYSNLFHILHALRQTSLREVNHIIWKYNFGVFTKTKYVSSHYHVLYYVKPGGDRLFNTEARYGVREIDDRGNFANYRDREDVWLINRQYKPQKLKNKNGLPLELLMKILQYSSKEGDVVCDFFLGGFTAAKVAIGLNRRFIGFEVSEKSFQYHIGEIKRITPGFLLPQQKKPIRLPKPRNEGRLWSPKDLAKLKQRFVLLKRNGQPKHMIVKDLMQTLGRGRWAIEHALKRLRLRYRKRRS